MSAQIHQLRSEASEVPSTASHIPPRPTKPTQEERTVIAAYVQGLKQRGFCKIDTEAAKETRLFNRFTGQVQSLSYLRNNFDEWLDATGNECEFFNERYFIRGLTHVVGQKFKPNAKDYAVDPATGYRYANTYRRYVPTTDSTDVDPIFLEFFERFIAVDRERHAFVQYLAHIFQRPDERPSWHPMLISEPGTGKGFLVQDILRPLLIHTSVVADYSRVMGQFSSVMSENLLVMLDDCKARSDATQTKLKSFLSEERAYIERKHAQGGMEDTYVRFILASNEDRPLHLDANERRWFVPARLVHRVDRHETQAFIATVAHWLKQPGSLCKVYNWFMSYPLDGFNHKDAPDSEGLSRIVAMSRNPYADFLEAYVADNAVFTYADLKDAFKADGLTPPGDRELGHLLREIGYEATQRRIDSNRLRLCHPAGMLLADIRKAYSTEF
ncbi:primase-helicase family protein [Cupriavidus plantarum]|uniref:NrS-1 polymerase-like helicase domain-containing protein n=1 Tax=Cupriavidus plantarum TaxID=942865 RepID=A0A316F4W0_9BURK|nr:primase-helicase family protein [Cupriavidus plantarum]PWK38673.1 hypothetical protein C7419_1012572 [Cupriavidus plantarum]